MKFISIFLSLMIVISSTQSAYAASASGWKASVSDTVMTGATAAITAFKGSGSTAMKSMISYKPTALAVGKEIIKGGGVIAVAYAMSKLLDAGVDWVLDPANNSVIYTVEGSVGSATSPSSVDGLTMGDLACRNKVISIWGADNGVVPYIRYKATGSSLPNSCVDSRNGSYMTALNAKEMEAIAVPIPPTKKSIPISTVADAVIGNAVSGHADSQDFVKAVAVGAVDAGELDKELDLVAEPTTDTPTDTPIDPSKPYDDSGIKSLLERILAALSGIAGISAILEFFKDEPVEKESKPVDVDVPQPTKAPSDFDVDYVRFGGQCPIMPSSSISVGVVSVPLSFDMSPLCDLANAIRPAVLSIAYFVALGLIVSAIRET